MTTTAAATTVKTPSPPTSPRQWPFNAARSTGTTCTPLLAAILAASTIDEISNSDGYADLEGYIRGQDRVDAKGRTLEPIMFWVYPTGFWGPYRETEEGGVKQHGLLVTIERGAELTEAMEAIRGNLPEDGTAHVHVPAR
ncbi:hypothetical protein DAEQUDRAFT_724486 [Daedalea quercina L-15889]|uniref:Uncharacterized protein n=1 Tax=Daedalea quercina L-15889 TaxID=1314783 RepID=A0A165RT05_9APHY|nr:hypothetical protein DAEQUDRAFT_724486 [Daedalea quercina L-15889]